MSVSFFFFFNLRVRFSSVGVAAFYAFFSIALQPRIKQIHSDVYSAIFYCKSLRLSRKSQVENGLRKWRKKERKAFEDFKLESFQSNLIDARIWMTEANNFRKWATLMINIGETATLSHPRYVCFFHFLSFFFLIKFSFVLKTYLF